MSPDAVLQGAQQLELGKASLLQLVESVPLGIIVCDRTGRIRMVNQLAEALFGYSPGEILGRSLETLVPPRMRPLHASQRDSYFAAPRPRPLAIGLELAGLRRDGSEFSAEISLSHFVLEETGEPMAVAYVYDNTARKLAESALMESEARAELVMESVVDYAIIELDTRGEIVSWNRGAEIIFGYPREEVMERHFSFYYPLELVEARLPQDLLKEAREQGHAAPQGWRLRKDGSKFWAESSISAMRNAAGHLLGFSIALRDRTERRQALETLRQSEARLARAQRIAQLGSWEKDLTGASQWSDELYRILGWNPQERPGSTAVFLEVTHPDDRQKVVDGLTETFTTGKAYDLVHRIVRPDGTVRYVRAHGEAVRDEAGRVIGIAGTTQDITELQRLEDQLRQAQKMEAVGQLAGGVAHDFNNLLTVINGYASMLREQLPPDSPLLEDATQIAFAGERAATMTRQLLAFSRKQVLQPRVVDLAEIITPLKPMLARVIPENIELRIERHPCESTVRIDPAQIEQVVLNLVVNARDAMPSGGVLTLETSCVHLDESYVASHAPMTVGDYALLAVSDTGCGMDRDTMERIFEPFFTTKPVGQGTGLGLSTVFGIIKQSGGFIWAYSELNQGTVLKIYLPRVAPEDAPAAEPGPAATLAAETGTVLLVEDEDSVRRFTARVLRYLGCEVIEAADGHAAIAASQRHSGEIGLLITDVIMPHMSGRELAARIAPLRPKMQVLFVSGYTEDTAIRNGVLEHGNRFLSKPFTAEQLASTVHDLLGAPPRSRAVLVVDDDPPSRQVLRLLLEREGYHVHEATDGEEALQAFRLTTVDLVITDLIMPNKEGLEMISDLRREFPHVQIMALSAADDGVLAAAKRRGAHVVLPKPLDPVELLGRVRQLLG